MSRNSRIPKTLSDKVTELDDHLFELRKSLHGLRTEDTSNLKVIAGELRNLICKSSGTEGLLWRLVSEVGVSDHVHVLCSGIFPDRLGLSTPQSEQLRPDDVFLSFSHRTGPPWKTFSFCDIVKTGEAVRHSGRGFTYEDLISKVANQMGTPHSDEGLEPLLVALKEHAKHADPNYFQLFGFLAEVTLEVGERVVTTAEKTCQVRRRLRPGFGDVSLFVSVVPELILTDRPTCFSYGSPIAAIDVAFTFESNEWRCAITTADGASIKTVTFRYHPNQSRLPILGAAWQYSSNLRRSRVINSFAETQDEFDCDLGWIDARDVMRFTKLKRRRSPEQGCILSHGVFDYLISTKEARELAVTVPDPTIIVGSHPGRVRKLQFDPSKSAVDQLFDAVFDKNRDMHTFPP